MTAAGMTAADTRIPAFAVPADDVAWCAALAEALSVCCSAPVDYRVAEVRALLAARPVQMLPIAWHALMAHAKAWLAEVGEGDAAALRVRQAPLFPGRCAIETALRDKPCAVPSWAERYS